MKLTKRILLIIALTLTFASCSSYMGVGKVKDDRYYTKDFNISVPKQGFNMQTYATKISDLQYFVTFYNDLGCELTYDILIMPKDLVDLLTGLNKEQLAASYKLNFERCTYAPILRKFPEAKILSEELVEMGDMGYGYFVFIEVPEGATYIDANTGKPSDGIRGYLVSYYKDQFIVISSQVSSIAELMGGKGTAKSDGCKRGMIEKLIKARLDYQYTAT